MKLSKIGLWLLTIFLIVGNTNAEGVIGITPHFEKVFEIDECEQASKKEVFVLLKIGEISKSDSLYGFDLEIKYDPSKISFSNVITQNTMSEFFEIKHFTILSEDSLVFGTAGHVNPLLQPYEGDQPLIGLYGNWIGDCSDTSEITISYINFFDEFKREVVKYESIKITSEVFDKPSRLLEYSFDTEKVEFVSDSSIIINMIIDGNGNKVSQQHLYFDVDLTEFSIDEVYSENTNVEIVQFDKIAENIYYLKINFSDDFNSDTVQLKIKNKGSFGDFSGILKTIPIKMDNCDCIKYYSTKELVLHSVVDDTVSVVERKNDIEAFFNRVSNCFEIRTNSDLQKNISLYDINGRLVYQDKIDAKEFQIKAEKLNKGMYLLIIRDEQGHKQIMNLIK